MERLPTQNRRDPEMEEFQQFSTPPQLSYLVAWVANVRAGETVLEPSGGTGNLVIVPDNAGAKLVLNELSERRSELLKLEFPAAQHFREDASQLNNVLPASVKPTLVLMNPPFSATAGRVEGKRSTMEGAKHIEQALKRLEPGGRLVAIVGEGMASTAGPRSLEWWRKIRADLQCPRERRHQRDASYRKYGTDFGVQLLVIDKDGTNEGRASRPSSQPTFRPEDVPALLEEVTKWTPSQ
jgi:predicted RNA methylase